MFVFVMFDLFMLMSWFTRSLSDVTDAADETYIAYILVLC